MEEQYNVKITKYALSQMKEIRDYIADELLVPQAAYDLFSEMKKRLLH
ncbi:MAG: addiction module toxin RelE [Ruminococcus sp.]|nr:addiction module toxin RelE [Ruminococcus sp.]